MKEKAEFIKKLQEVKAFYSSLSYEQQKVILRSLSSATKQPPFFIKFDLTNQGIVSMSQTINYCKKYSIPYTPEKRGNTKVSFRFDNLSDRNIALLGRLTEAVQKEEVKDAL